MTDKIIHAFPSKELPECPVEEAPRRWKLCDHSRITLVEHDRAVICQDCGASLDPFKYLLDGARAIRRGWQDYQQVKLRVSEQLEKLAALEKERKRLAGQVRRLKEKAAPDVLDVRKPL